MDNTVSYSKKKQDFIEMLSSVSKEQLTDFIKMKGHEPKKIKPFICLNINQ